MTSLLTRSKLHSTHAPTGIMGLDESMRGGLPRGRTTLLEGGAGCGKTVFALQTLAHCVRERKEPSIFVAFEESPHRIVSNVRGFAWDLEDLQNDGLFMSAAPVRMLVGTLSENEVVLQALNLPPLRHE
ncbi:MAG: ATPase domain-containing protein [Bradymonadaceae bacterium]